MKPPIEATAVLPADRLDARLLAHALVEQVQTAPCPGLVDRLAGQAGAAGWGEVEVLLRQCQLLHSSLQGGSPETIRRDCDAMLRAAESSGEEILLALALASRALFLVDTDGAGAAGEDLGGGLARAVAILEQAADSEPGALGLRALELPTSFVECGQAYHRRGLWELEDEMYRRACEALERPLPESVRPAGDHTRRALVVNRLESAAALISALLEVGGREQARTVALSTTRPDAAERAQLPAMWAVEVRALEYFLDAVAGRGPAPKFPDEIWDALARSTWQGYRACLLLADAVRALDAHDRAGCAERAARAVDLLDDYKPSITTLAWHLATRTGTDRAALRYAERLAELRWQDRLGILGAARTRLAAARVLRESEQLSRQALEDGLTGLANRHAETHYLARLRESGPLGRVAVVLVDVDHFKAVNDTFGHAVGDEVLRAVGALLRKSVRSSSDLAVRRGGDEFMLLVDLSDGPHAAFPVDEVVDAVAGHDWSALAPGLRVRVSAGSATGPATGVDDVIRAADRNLYRAKAAGRGRAVTGTPAD